MQKPSTHTRMPYEQPAHVRNPKQWVDTREAQVTMMLNDKLAADAGLLTRDEAARAIVELQHALAAVLVDPSACENLGSPGAGSTTRSARSIASSRGLDSRR